MPGPNVENASKDNSLFDPSLTWRERSSFSQTLKNYVALDFSVRSKRNNLFSQGCKASFLFPSTPEGLSRYSWTTICKSLCSPGCSFCPGFIPVQKSTLVSTDGIQIQSCHPCCLLVSISLNKHIEAFLSLFFRETTVEEIQFNPPGIRSSFSEGDRESDRISIS